MKNDMYSKMGIVLLLIGVFGVLNAVGDIITLILMITQSFGGNGLFGFFFNVFANKDLFLIAMPLTLFCNILFLVFLLRQKFVLFQLFFFASCIIAMIHLLVNLFSLYPLTVFEIMVNANTLISATINPMLGLLKTTYPAFLIIGILASFGILFACYLYFKRSKQVKGYFGSKTTI